jgi:hypothetical protein
MRKGVVAGLGAAVLGAASLAWASADAQGPPRGLALRANDAVGVVPYPLDMKVRRLHAVRITDLRTGGVYIPEQGQGQPRALMDGWNAITNKHGLPNIAAVDFTDPNDEKIICDLRTIEPNDPRDIQGVFLGAQGNECDPNDRAIVAELCIETPGPEVLDVIFDSYFLDQSTWGPLFGGKNFNDPNDFNAADLEDIQTDVRELEFLFLVRRPEPTDRTVRIWTGTTDGFWDGQTEVIPQFFDPAGDGRETFAEVSIDVEIPAGFAGLASVTAAFPPGVIATPVRGHLFWDFAREEVDPNTGQPSGVPACGLGRWLSHGNIAGSPVALNFGFPTTEPNKVVDPNCWPDNQGAAGEQVTQFGDENLYGNVEQAVGADVNCSQPPDPNLSPAGPYGDLFATNSLYVVVIPFEDKIFDPEGFPITGSNDVPSLGTTWRMALGEPNGPVCGCPGNLSDTGDPNGTNCDTDLDDLTVLLQNFLGTNVPSPGGDLDNDNDTDLDDLTLLLQDFGCTNP